MDEFRAQDWSEFVGQPSLKNTLEVHCLSARKRVRPLDHVLLVGPPGYGKTTLAHLLAARVLDPITTLPMPATMASFKHAIGPDMRGILWLDELHRWPRSAQESLLTLMEEGRAEFPDGSVLYKGWLTVVAATTKGEMIDAAVAERFAITPVFEPYDHADLVLIARGMLAKAGVSLCDATIDVLADASGGLPRSVRNLVVVARDIAVAFEREPSVEEILEVAQVDTDGLGPRELRYLACLANGSTGLSSLSSQLRLSASSITNMERLLVQRGYIVYSGAGRTLTERGRERIAA